MFFCDSLSLWLLLITGRYKNRVKNELCVYFDSRNKGINDFNVSCERRWYIGLVFDLDPGNAAGLVM